MPFPPPPDTKKVGLFSLARLKSLRWPLAVATLVGAPYAYFEGGEWTAAAKDAISAWTKSAGGANGDANSSSSATNAVGGPIADRWSQSQTPPIRLGEVFNFDVTTAWIASRWPRVSVGLSQVDLSGYRVELVTGTRPSDLAGALTYYFDQNQSVKRITFEGATGDPGPLIAELTSRHRFVRCKGDIPGTDIYQVHKDDVAIGDLRIRLAPVLRTDAPLGRYSVSVRMDRPESG